MKNLLLAIGHPPASTGLLMEAIRHSNTPVPVLVVNNEFAQIQPKAQPHALLESLMIRKTYAPRLDLGFLERKSNSKGKKKSSHW